MALAPAVYIPGLVFEAIVRVRGRCYSAGLLPQHRLPAPVVSVGNITLGGAGKTPLVIFIARMILKLGHTPAVLTRGYGRIRPGDSLILSPEEEVPSPDRTIGDEPALIRRSLPSVWMGVSKNRFHSGGVIVKRARRTVFLLDDGFQHRRLHRDLDIVMIDSRQPLAVNHIFPRGTLREPLSGLCRCNLIVINGDRGSPESDSVEEEIRKRTREAEIFYCSQSIGSLLPFSSWQTVKSGEASGTLPATIPSAYLVAAVGNPARFRRDVQRLGIEIGGERFFPDHHRLTGRDWRTCTEDAARKKTHMIITTEKDAVKIAEPPDFPLLVAIQSTGISDAGAFELILKKCIEERR